MSEKPVYEADVTIRDASGRVYKPAYGEVRSADDPDTVARSILESLQSQRGKDYVRIIDADK